jgi:hypothetical protein
MPLAGAAFIGMWHDIEVGREAEYQLWHTREHMPERLALPGFLRGRRGVGPSEVRQRYLTVYEGETLEVFRSAEYLERLNRPTPWSARMAGHFRNFLRVACETVSTAGAGAGGAMATIRADLAAEVREDDFVSGAAALSEKLMGLGAVCGVHVGMARPLVAKTQTTESALRPRMAEPAFDAAILVEGTDADELEALRGPIGELVTRAGAAQARIDVYRLAYLLGRHGGS